MRSNALPNKDMTLNRVTWLPLIKKDAVLYCVIRIEIVACIQINLEMAAGHTDAVLTWEIWSLSDGESQERP